MRQQLPLSDFTVLELAGMIPGPYATMLLSDLGAEVIKVEEPESGDYQRQFGPETDGINHRFANYNRNKESIALDLKSDRGRAVLLELVEESDVLLEGFRPGVVDRLGIGYDEVSARNPGLVYCSLSGYGQNGPYREWVGHDINYLGLSGMLAMTGERDGPPVAPGYPISDFAGGIFAAFTIVSMLHQREQTGEGEYIDLSMTDVAASWSQQLLATVAAGQQPRRGETLVSGNDPSYNIYECADGEYITLGALEPAFWKRLCDELSLEASEDADLSDPAVREAVREELTEAFAQQSRDEWIASLDETEIPVAPVYSPDETLTTDEQIEARELVREQDIDGTTLSLMGSPYKLASEPEMIRNPAPDHGGDTTAILERLGYDDDGIGDLFDDGIVTSSD
ncbi:MAG: CaiB/BaiF CoA transferase family protein [Halorientalis sp.]